MRTRELLFPAAAVCCTLAFTYQTLCHAAWDRRRGLSTPAPVVLAAAPAEVIGSHPSFMGSAQAPYTLVEFADYQCPPCAQANKEMVDLLAPYAGQVRFTYRNFPLQTLHKQSFAAAIFAEAARAQGRFWPVHDALYQHQDDLSPSALYAILGQQSLDRSLFNAACATTARAVVEEDVRCAERLHLSSTPTFLLCCTDGRVIRLGSIHQLSEYVKP